MRTLIAAKWKHVLTLLSVTSYGVDVPGSRLYLDTLEKNMKTARLLLLPALLLAFPLSVLADPDKDESGHGKGRAHERREYRDDYGHDKDRKRDRREFKEEYTDGNCKVERKREKNGDYKEERKCKGRDYGHYDRTPAYVPAPPARYEDPGVTIRGTIRVP